MKYQDALEVMASATGFAFLPDGADTCPRVAIEAKLLGLETHFNENVQHKDEKWFTTDDLNEVDSYLRAVPKTFWDKTLGKSRTEKRAKEIVKEESRVEV